ncbi:MAG: 3'-5' exonuclease [Polyangiaceae bacterium]
MGAPPPEGSPWDLPFAEAPLAFVDLEMTGLDHENDRVVEVCIDRVVGDRRVEILSTLVKPPERCGGNAHVHGLDADALAKAPSFGEIAPAIEKILDGAILVAHGAIWDVRFLQAEMKRLGRPFKIAHYIDTLSLTRRAFAFSTHSLDALCVQFGIQRGIAHRAEHDVVALRAVFAKCIESLAPATPRDLWEVRISERHARPEIVQACVQMLEAGPETALEIVYRPARKPPQNIVLVVTAVRPDLDPPRVIGYQLPGRGRRELRADRILRVTPVERP